MSEQSHVRNDEHCAEKIIKKFVPVEIGTDLESLSTSERRVLPHLVKAAIVLNEVYERQQGIPLGLTADVILGTDSLVPTEGRQAYRIMRGPWDRTDEDRPFIGSTPKPLGAGYYPLDMSKEEFEKWVADHPEQEAAFRSDFTVIRRNENGELTAVPYSEEYKEPLSRSAAHLRAGAEQADNELLRNFLLSRAEAFETNDYIPSDMAWMDVESIIEPTIGPYENYDDMLLGYKASFEAYISIVRPKESADLERFNKLLPWLERNLPIDDEYKNFERGTESPIRVVDLVYSSGEGDVAFKASAYNLPNLEPVREAKGSKKVLMYNIMQHKYDHFLSLVAERVLTAEDAAKVSFEAYYQLVLHHENGHGLGPGNIIVDGRKTDVRSELKELYNPFEELKADVISVYNILAMIELGAMPGELRQSLEPTYVADTFRPLRFGVHEAHARGGVAQLNYLIEQGAIEMTPEGRYCTNSDKFPGAIRSLLNKILTLQATGDYDGTKRFLETYGTPSAQMIQAVESMNDMPVDLDIVFTYSDETV